MWRMGRPVGRWMMGMRWGTDDFMIFQKQERAAAKATDQSTVPPASASILRNNCLISAEVRFFPRCGPSLSQNCGKRVRV